MEVLADAFSHDPEVSDVGNARAQHRELVAAYSCGGVTWTNRGENPPCHRREHLVALSMTPGVVDGLEAVDVEEDQPYPLATFAFCVARACSTRSMNNERLASPVN